MALVVSFAGQIGSGKSSVSQSLAEVLRWPRTGFGSYLRKEATRLGLDPDSRKVLQDLGQSRVDEDADGFCRAVLEDGGFVPGQSMLVDGVRHVQIQQSIAQIVRPAPARLIYLKAGESERLLRVGNRADGQRDFGRAEAHRVEAELQNDLPAIADSIVDAEQPIEDVLRSCEAVVLGWQSEA